MTGDDWWCDSQRAVNEMSLTFWLPVTDWEGRKNKKKRRNKQKHNHNIQSAAAKSMECFVHTGCQEAVAAASVFPPRRCSLAAASPRDAGCGKVVGLCGLFWGGFFVLFLGISCGEV